MPNAFPRDEAAGHEAVRASLVRKILSDISEVLHLSVHLQEGLDIEYLPAYTCSSLFIV